MKKTLLAIALLFGWAALAQAQTTTCPGPTPGQPHVCLKWTDSTTAGSQYFVYRATTPGAENYAAPLNSTAMPAGTTAFYDATTAVGTTYYYTAAAFLVVGSGPGGVLSPPTPEVSAQTPVPPDTPANFTASID